MDTVSHKIVDASWSKTMTLETNLPYSLVLSKEATIQPREDMQ